MGSRHIRRDLVLNGGYILFGLDLPQEFFANAPNNGRGAYALINT